MMTLLPMDMLAPTILTSLVGSALCCVVFAERLDAMLDNAIEKLAASGKPRA
jgi:hypothetical protein